MRWRLIQPAIREVCTVPQLGSGWPIPLCVADLDDLASSQGPHTLRFVATKGLL